MKFTIPQIDDFLSLSGDTNPLHADDAFAKAAGFEQRVVPGMLAVRSSMHPTIPAKTVKARFSHPLYPDVQYRTGLDMNRDLFWLGDEKRVSVWRDCSVTVQHWEIADEPHVGDYHTTDVVSRQSLVLCWISWFVGTQLPGHGGILSGIEVEFLKDTNPPSDKLSYGVRIAQQKFGMVVLDAVLSEGDEVIAYAELRAMEAKK